MLTATTLPDTLLPLTKVTLAYDHPAATNDTISWTDLALVVLVAQAPDLFEDTSHTGQVS